MPEIEGDWLALPDVRQQEVDVSQGPADRALSSWEGGLGDQGRALQGSHHVYSNSSLLRAEQGPPSQLRRAPTEEGPLQPL